MTLKEEIVKILLDKLAIGGLLLLAGFIINKAIERFKSAEALRNEISKQKFVACLQLIERQLAEFYWPIYLRLEKDNIIWERILDQEKDDDDDPLKKIGELIEKDVIIPNHEEIVRIIESKIHLAQLDRELSDSLFLYIKHVAVYKAAKAANISNLHSTQRALLPPWPERLYPEIEKRTRVLQDEYDNLLSRYKSL